MAFTFALEIPHLVHAIRACNFQPKIVDAELRMHETVVLKILHLIYIKLNIALQ